MPANAPTLFQTAPRSSGAPCLTAPEPNTLMPRNWLRPQFVYTPSSGENLFKIQLSTAAFADPYTVYTTQTTYTLDATLWNALRLSVNDAPIEVTVSAMNVSSSGAVQLAPSAPAHASFTIAPVDAPGKIVYWAIPTSANGEGDGVLKGFGIGEESVETVLTGTQVVARNTTQDTCIGCHAATPDGDGVGFVFGPPQSMIGLDTYYNTMADIQQATVGALPSFVATSAETAIRTLRGIPAYSRSHWSAGDRIVLLTDAQNQGQLLWVQLDADNTQGTLARTGDSGGATEPTFSHDGTRVVYVSSMPSSIHDGRLDSGPAGLFSIPYSNRTGGTATAVSGAAESGYTEYYPAFAPDDAFVAFTRISGSASVYANPQSEVFVVSAAGGTALRFAANDPPACQTSVHSPGVTNDWPKWAPEATTAANGTTYYWATFSSTRSGHAQLYVAPMTVTAGTVDVDYPALYLWNQPTSDDNHTPSWDDYQIPPIVIN